MLELELNLVLCMILAHACTHTHYYAYTAVLQSQVKGGDLCGSKAMYYYDVQHARVQRAKAKLAQARHVKITIAGFAIEDTSLMFYNEGGGGL